MYKTRVCLANASTSHGMRRILKVLPPVAKYIRQAVDAGIYYPQDADRQKRSTPYGTSLEDYPIEYQILTLHPPIPPKPRTPKRLRPKKPTLPTTRLAQTYLRKQQQQQESSPRKDTYYQQILGIPPKTANSMAFKSHEINKAYAVALKQYELIRTNEGMAEDEALSMVEDLLRHQDLQERQSSRNITETLVQERNEKQQQQETSCSTASSEATENDGTDKTSKENDDSDNLLSSVPSVLHSKPRTVRGMHIWSQRLQQIPYKQWTVGATTALDHWIARSVLDWDESTWQDLLDGNTVELKSRGIDLIQARQALFPETILDQQDDVDDELDDIVEDATEQPQQESKEKSIDDLLASLGAFDDDDEETFLDTAAEKEKDAKVLQLVEELQSWRTRHAENPYEEWSSEQQEEFGTWLQDYASTVTSEADQLGKEVDMTKTRQALLSGPPMMREESDGFWSKLRDEASAAEFLETADISTLPNAFQELPRELQVSRLVELGTMEPLWNEYTPESVRIQFLQRHSDKLLEGLGMEHLVSDKQGPIKASDMGDAWMQQHGIVNKEERFRIKKLPEDSEKYLEAYTTHKAGRARYEELMFQKGKLGLKYSDKAQDSDEEDD